MDSGRAIIVVAIGVVGVVACVAFVVIASAICVAIGRLFAGGA